MTIGDRLKELRIAYGFSQSELAKAMGWEGMRARISNYEVGNRMPNSEDIESFATLFNVSPAYIQFGDNLCSRCKEIIWKNKQVP
jgi:transcriptional regulator with XRE-family HTH domain